MEGIHHLPTKGGEEGRRHCLDTQLPPAAAPGPRAVALSFHMVLVPRVPFFIVLFQPYGP